MLKQNLSKNSLKSIKETSQRLDMDEEYLIENSLGISKSGFPKIRNEKISGDTATIELKNDLTGKWDQMPFVKENGRWKIDLEKFTEDAVKEFNDNQNKF